MERTKTAEEILREYIEFDDVNGSETISILPLTIVDMMEEYKNHEPTQQQEIHDEFRKTAVKSGMLYLSLNWDEPLPIDEALLKKHKEDQNTIKELKKQNAELANLLKDTFNFPKDDLIEWANGSKMITITLHPSHFERFNQMFQNTDQQNN